MAVVKAVDLEPFNDGDIHPRSQHSYGASIDGQLLYDHKGQRTFADAGEAIDAAFAELNRRARNGGEHR